MVDTGGGFLLRFDDDFVFPLDSNSDGVIDGSDNAASLVNVTYDGQTASSLQLDITTFMQVGVVTMFNMTAIPVSSIDLV